MTRKECEKKLLDLMEQAYRIFNEFDPRGNHLSMFATSSGHCAMGYKKTAAFETETIIDGFKSMDGYYRFSERG